MEKQNSKFDVNAQEWSKRCINCDAYGYKTANDWKYGRKYCFTHKVYINKPADLVCAQWQPTD